MIVPTGWYSGAKYNALRRFVACTSDPQIFVNLPYDIFKAWVDTTVFVLAKRTVQTSWPRQDSCTVRLRTFPKRYRITAITEFDDDTRTVNFADWFTGGGDEYLTYADSVTSSLIRKMQALSKPLQEFADVQRV